MVCVPCVIIPVFLWVWFTFIMPVIYKLKAMIWPGADKGEKKEETQEEKDAKMQCPFDFCKKQKPASETAEVSTESKKTN